jgi:hypothetical protein
MNTANATGVRAQWEGRLGVEFVGKMQGCCASTLQAWKPQSPGQRNSCAYCGSAMKTIRAGQEEDNHYHGGLNEHLLGVKKEELVIGGLFFTSDRFASVENADTWMDDREIAAKAVALDMHSQYAHLEELRPETTRAIWVAPGVVGQIGVSKQGAAATGAGQASMHSPGITTTSMATGGTAHPDQGPAAFAVGQGGMPTLVTGMVEMNDGHQHEFNLVPYPAADGWRVKGFTSFNNGHQHFIEASLNDDGTLDMHTNPDQSPVGGHAHRHRATWMPGMTAALPKTIADEITYERSGAKEYRITSQDVVLLKRASGMIQNFCKNVRPGGPPRRIPAHRRRGHQEARGLRRFRGEVHLATGGRDRNGEGQPRTTLLRADRATSRGSSPG